MSSRGSVRVNYMYTGIPYTDSGEPVPLTIDDSSSKNLSGLIDDVVKAYELKSPRDNVVTRVIVRGPSGTRDGGALSLSKKDDRIVIDHVHHPVPPWIQHPGGVDDRPIEVDDIHSYDLVWRDSSQRTFASNVLDALRAAGFKVEFSPYLKQETEWSVHGLPADDFNQPTPSKVKLDKIEHEIGSIQRGFYRPFRQQLKRRIKPGTKAWDEAQEVLQELEEKRKIILSAGGPPPKSSARSQGNNRKSLDKHMKARRVRAKRPNMHKEKTITQSGLDRAMR